MIDLYRNIKEKRKELGFSQDELAKRVGYSGKSMISKIEKGEVDLSTTMIKKFSEVLHTTPSELMGDPLYYDDSENKEDSFQERKNDTPAISARATSLMEKITDLPDSSLDEIERFVEYQRHMYQQYSSHNQE